ncbi:MAG: hypothetical protein IPL79_11115 [Myxococcales bacterium]|nr:hypothetical protein [Myxococcales bacterium]
MNARTITLIGVVASLAFMGALMVGLSGGDQTTEADAPPTTTYSYSLLGHRALLELLGKLGVPAAASQHASMSRACGHLMVVAEPDGSDASLRDVTVDLPCPKAILFVLPKWEGDVDEAGFVRTPSLVSTSRVHAVLAALELDGSSVARLTSPSIWRTEGAPVPIAAVTDLQLLGIDDALEPVISTETGGILLARHANYENVYILADPDFINNQGLQRGQAAFAVGLLRHLGGDSAVVFDETVHGLKRSRSVWRALFAFPLALIAAHRVVVWLLLVWAFAKNTSGGEPEAAREGGFRYLVRNTASLLHGPAHRRNVLLRYLDAARLHVNVALGRTQPMTPSDLAARQDARRVTTSLAVITQRTQTLSDKQLAQDGVQLARAAYVWRKEMTDES